MSKKFRTNFFVFLCRCFDFAKVAIFRLSRKNKIISCLCARSRNKTKAGKGQNRAKVEREVKIESDL